MDYKEILFEVTEKVATITLHRPDRLNAFTTCMMRELVDVFDQTDANDDVRAVVMTGAGRGFCAGADLSEGAETFAHGGSPDVAGPEGISRDGGGQVALRIFRSHKPVIAAFNGPAVGVGVTMTLPMDIRLASTNAKFGFVFARRGIVPEACSSFFLPRIVGINQAAEWVYTGRLFGPDEALRAGLIRSVHEPADLLPAAHEMGREIAENTAPVAVAMSRQMLWRMLGASHPMEAHRIDSRGVAERGKTADAAEGVTSFLQKRSPRYPDRVSDGWQNIFPDWQEPEFY